MKYKILSQEMVENLISFLDEIQFDAAAENTPEDMHKVNFCQWAIEELLNSYDAIVRNEDRIKPKGDKKKPKPKSRDQFVDETFMDWNLPEMSDEEFEKLVDSFDAFLRGWEKEYNKKNKNNPKKKPIKERPYKPRFEDVAEYCTLEEIKEMLLDDPELTDNERFELYYEEHDRVRRKKEKEKEAKNSVSYDKMLNDLGISPSTNNDKGDKNVKKDNK
tara:strand:- start:297 stop:950 length:654 start_codon:yes stop_codon:yes gene_type:complete